MKFTGKYAHDYHVATSVKIGPVTYLAHPFEDVLVDPSAGVVVVQAPASPLAGMEFVVSNVSASWGRVKVEGNGNLIRFNSNRIIAHAYSRTRFKYTGTKWAIDCDEISGFNDVRKCGMECDGIVDDTAALQTLLTGVDGTGQAIYLPPALIKITDTLTMGDKFALIGCNNTTSVNDGHPGTKIDASSVTYGGSGTKAVLNATNKSHITIKGVYIKLPEMTVMPAAYYDPYNGLIGIRMRAADSLIENVTTERGHTGIYCENANGIDFKNVYSFAALHHNWSFNGSQNIKIKNGMPANAGSGYSPGGDVCNIFAMLCTRMNIDCQIVDECFGAGSKPIYIQESTNIKLRGQTLYTGASHGIHINYISSNILIEGFGIQRWGGGVIPVGIEIDATCSKVVLRDINITTGGGTAITDSASDTIYDNVKIDSAASIIGDHTRIANRGTNAHSVIDSHIGSTSNPHSVTASQVGLGSVTNAAQLTRGADDWDAFDSKSPLVAADVILIEDSAAGGAKKESTIGGIPHGQIADIGTNAHSAIDSFIGSKAQASGLASLDGSSKVVQNPANATATPTASKIPIADGAGKLDSGWLPSSSGILLLVFGTRYVLDGYFARPGNGEPYAINELKIRLPVAKTLTEVRVRSRTAPGTTVTDVYTVRKNGVNTAAAVSLGPAATTGTYSGSIAFAADDDVSVILNTSGGVSIGYDTEISILFT